MTRSPGLGYLGTYRLAWVHGGEQIPADITIGSTSAAASSEREVRMAVDVMRAGEKVSGAITIADWALDPLAWSGSGMDAVHVWAQRVGMAAVAPSVRASS